MLTYELKDRIAYLTLNRPEKRNALNGELVAQLTKAFSKASEDTHAKVIVLKAAGKAFCAGADLQYLQQLQNNSYAENLADSSQLATLFHTIYSLDKVVIAQIQGHALAGGCGLAAICDFSFCVPHALFGYTEVKIGFIPAIVSVFLTRKIGEARARELLLSGETITAEKALQYQLINFMVEANELEERVNSFASQLCQSNSGQSMAFTKKLIVQTQDMNLQDGLTYAAAMNAKARNSEDCQRGIAAFLNKEAIQW